MRFKDIYEKESEKNMLSDEFINNLAEKMAEAAQQTKGTKRNNKNEEKIIMKENNMFDETNGNTETASGSVPVKYQKIKSFMTFAACAAAIVLVAAIALQSNNDGNLNSDGPGNSVPSPTTTSVSGNTETTSVSQTDMTTETSLPSKTEVLKPVKYTSADTAKYDLDNDGSIDTINFTPSVDDPDYLFSALTVNGKKYESLLVTPDFFWICDIDTSDNFLEIAVSSFGMSDDYQTEFYRLENNYLKSIGSVEDFIDNMDDSNNNQLNPVFNKQAVLNGDGTISAAYRLDIFQTWFARSTYTYNDSTGKLEEHSDIYYPYGEENKDDYGKVYDIIFGNDTEPYWAIPKTNSEIHLYSKMDRTSTPVKLSPQEFLATATDNKNWVYIVGKNGTTGWLYVIDYQNAYDAASGESFIYTDVMENLFLYD